MMYTFIIPFSLWIEEVVVSELLFGPCRDLLLCSKPKLLIFKDVSGNEPMRQNQWQLANCLEDVE